MRRLKISLKSFAVLITLFSLQGCAAYAVADAAVGTTVFVAKTAVKGTVGAGKLVYRGGKAVTNGVTGGGRDDTSYSNEAPSCLNEDGTYSDALIDAQGVYYCP